MALLILILLARFGPQLGLREAIAVAEGLHAWFPIDMLWEGASDD